MTIDEMTALRARMDQDRARIAELHARAVAALERLGELLSAPIEPEVDAFMLKLADAFDPPE